MSYSRTQNPSVSRTRRGRGRGVAYSSGHTGRISPYNPAMDTSQQLHHSGVNVNRESEVGGSERGIHDATSERTMQSHGTHYSLAPDPSKNSRLKKNAQEEEAEYMRYKETKRERITQELTGQPPRRVGGAALTTRERDELIKEKELKQQRDARFAAVRSRQKREEYRKKEREIEDEKIRKHKEFQREKAMRLEARRQKEEEVDLEELRGKRLARFKLFDTQR